MASGSRVSHLRHIVALALVIHGTHDTLYSLEHGRSIASHIPDAKFMEIDGMGHNLDGDLSLITADAIVAHARKVQGSQKPRTR
jgi:pimeloyl-ACP methyl ester carboxylesterase